MTVIVRSREFRQQKTEDLMAVLSKVGSDEVSECTKFRHLLTTCEKGFLVEAFKSQGKTEALLIETGRHLLMDAPISINTVDLFAFLWSKLRSVAQ